MQEVAQEVSVEKKEIETKKRVDWGKVLEYSLPAIFAICICLFAMIVTGAYPFGKNTIGYVDVEDGLIPAYTYLWDVLHGKADVLVTWNLGAGGSFVSSAVLNGFLSPISWLIAIFPRASVVYGVAFILIIRLALMATTAYICFKKFFPKVNRWVLLMFAMVWTFSGWTMTYWTNIGWLDLIILLPLLVLSLRKLEEEGKILWFVIVLSYLLMLSYYISYMILVGLVIVATVYIFTLSKNRKRTASLLFFGTIISILISAFAFIPSMLTSLQGHRFSGIVEESAHDLYLHFGSKLAVLMMTGLPFVFFIKLLATYKKDKKNVLFFMISFIILSIGLIIEPINEMWHTGSYMSFPFRYSFVIILFVIFGALYYVNKHITTKNEQELSLKESERGGKKGFKFNVLYLLPACVMAFLISLGAIVTLSVGMVPVKVINVPNACLYVLLFLSGWGTIECLLKLKNEKVALGKLKGGILIFVLVMVQIVSLFTSFLTVPGSATSEHITNSFKINTTTLEQGYKLKDKDSVYNRNFPYLTDYCSLKTWIHISSEGQYQGYNMLGYNSFSTELMSSGGTLLTDVILGNKYVLSQEELPSGLYSKIDSFEFIEPDRTYEYDELEKTTMNLYELNLNFEKVFLTDANLSSLLEVEEKTDYVANQNAIFKALYGVNEDIMQGGLSYAVEEIDEGHKVTVSAPVGYQVYAISDYSGIINIVSSVYGKTIMFGLNDLGVSSGTVEFVLDKEYNINNVLENLSFASFNTELFVSTHQSYDMGADIELKTDGSSLKIDINNTSSKKYALIPYTYLKNMVGQNNGEEIEVQTAFETFMFVELESGENDIVITYEPQLITPCLIITIASILLFVIFAIINKKFRLSDKKWVMWTGTVGACVILLVVGFLVYAKPFVEFFVLLFTGW